MIINPSPSPSYSIRMDKKLMKRVAAKTNKKVDLLWHPFSIPFNADKNNTDFSSSNGNNSSTISNQYPTTAATTGFRNQFTDNARRLLLGIKINTNNQNDTDGDDNDDDSDDDEARVIQARRDALAALDPKNKNAKTAEFKSFKVMSSSSYIQSNALSSAAINRTNTLTAKQQEQQQRRQPLKSEESIEQCQPSISDSEQPPLASFLPHSNINFEPYCPLAISPSSPSSVRSSFSHQARSIAYNSDGTLSTPNTRASQNPRGRDLVPEIPITFATPSPHLASSHQHTPSNAALCSSISPSFIAVSSLLNRTTTEDDQDVGTDDCGLSSAGTTKASGTCQSTRTYRDQSHRVGPLFNQSNDQQGRSVNEIKQGGELEDYISAQVQEKTGITNSITPVWPLNRNTFGTTQKQHGQRGQRDQNQEAQTYHKRDISMNGLDRWGAASDIPMHDSPISLQNKRNSSGLGVPESQPLKSVVSRKKRSRDGASESVDAEDWTVHSRTVAIHDTVETIPVSSKSLKLIPLDEEYATISLTSPQVQKCKFAADSRDIRLSRGRPLDVSLGKLKKGVSSIISGNNALEYNSSHYATEDEDIQQTVDDGLIKDPFIEYSDRSSSATFGCHKPPASLPPDLHEAVLPPFSSFRELISSTTSIFVARLNPLSSLSKYNGDVSPPMLSPLAPTFLRRSRAIVFSEHLGLQGNSDYARDRYIGTRRKNTPAMFPTIVIPQHTPAELSALSATTVLCTPSSESPSMTMTHDQYLSYITPYREDSPANDKELSVYCLGSSENHYNGSNASLQRMFVQQQQQQQCHLEGLLNTPQSTFIRTRNCPSPLALAAMSAVERPLSRSSIGMASGFNADYLMRSPSNDECIGQLKRKQEQSCYDNAFIDARNKNWCDKDLGPSSKSLSSLATKVGHRSEDLIKNQDGGVRAIDMDKLERVHHHNQGGWNDCSFGYGPGYALDSLNQEEKFRVNCEESKLAPGQQKQRISDPNDLSSFTPRRFLGFGFMKGVNRGGNGRNSKEKVKNIGEEVSLDYGHYSCSDDDGNGDRQHSRQPSEHLETCDKMIPLPKSSRFNGICLCHKFMNVTNMIFILSGLVLLVLGYPIATSLKKAKLVGEEAAKTTTSSASSIIAATITPTTSTTILVKLPMAKSIVPTIPISGHTFLSLGKDIQGDMNLRAIVPKGIVKVAPTAMAGRHVKPF
ncbi:hypothetical protein BX616_010214 [Lobosporangium transversale]|uniref:Uncharacterized protein n=1 Tax=Lobosporangium transversale TaxID=64571 RepID=A0A1Y2H297_9FUNG|nr:hypothetical protein BCR41DRAFT_391568 [Lobosporangium transversale]KAF9912868.1 hypothetical protein BX616_010214 [Lobosporangium transversale]ORZ28101.1 hypothetical protein BCR41DRAFT_391568 [Lobosporangium transversale]|eukprot:XP_021885786.1 hypothetical protein BCR41DRAFT_391568 [Lobosporangium transversale]